MVEIISKIDPKISITTLEMGIKGKEVGLGPTSLLPDHSHSLLQDMDMEETRIRVLKVPREIQIIPIVEVVRVAAVFRRLLRVFEKHKGCTITSQ